MSKTTEISNSWARSWVRAKHTATEWLAVFIAAAGFVFGVVGLLVGILAMWVAYDANENAKIAEMRLINHLTEEHE